MPSTYVGRRDSGGGPFSDSGGPILVFSIDVGNQPGDTSTTLAHALLMF